MKKSVLAIASLITVLAIASLIIFPFFYAEGKDAIWIAAPDGSSYTLTPEFEHIVQDRSVNYFSEPPFDIRELDSYSITLEVESSDTEWSEAGIVFGGDEGDFHFFIINSYDRYFTYGAHKSNYLNKNWRDFIYREKTDGFSGASNTISIQKNSERLELYINGGRVAHHDLPDLDGMKIGYYLRGDSLFIINEIEVQIK